MHKLTTFAAITAMSFAFAGTTLANSDATKKPETAKPVIEGMLLPFMSPSKGRKLFASKGCVVCHSINGVGGEDAVALDAATMGGVMNPFDFAAKMWRGAATMISVQEEELGEQIEFTGNELANIIAFVHSAEEQKKFSEADIPEKISKLMGHVESGTEEHKEKEHNEDKPKE